MTYNALNQYKQNTVFSATPEELTLMLYDGAIKFMKIGKHHIEKQNTNKAHEALMRAQAIVRELNISLNMEYELSENLRALYDFALDKLIDANIYKNTQSIDQALEIITDMRDTWKEAMTKVKRQVYEGRRG